MFTIFDIFIFVIITVSAMSGIHKGLINMTVNLLGFVCSILLAIFLFPYTKFVLIGNVESELVISVLSGIISYICSLFILSIVTSKMIYLLEGVSRGFFDRIFGLIAGAIRGILISLVVFIIIATFVSGAYLKAKNAEDLVKELEDGNKYPKWLTNSETTNYLQSLLKRSAFLFSEDTLKAIKLPKSDSSDSEDIIDSIKKSKEVDSSSVNFDIDEDLEEQAKSLIQEE